MNTKVIKYNGKWTVSFGYGVQSFKLLTYCDTKKEAKWHESMLKACFENYIKSKGITLTLDLSDLSLPEYEETRKQLIQLLTK